MALMAKSFSVLKKFWREILILFLFATCFTAMRSCKKQQSLAQLNAQWAIFVLLFDYVLNLLRGLDWWYVDEGLDGKQSWMDSIYTQLPWWAIMFVKIWVFLLGFSVYFFISYVV